MDAPRGGRAPRGGGSADHASADPGTDPDVDAGLVVEVLHRVGRCPLKSLLGQPELDGWTPVRLEQAVVSAWNGGLVFIDRNDDLVAL